VVVTSTVNLETHGNCDVVNITREIADAVTDSGLADGIACVFCPGATGGLTTLEFEPGVVADVQRAFDSIAPPDGHYRHHLQWGDDNGHSHVRAALVGPSLTVPFCDGLLRLGTWQQIVLIDFDTRPRSRELVLQLVGE
jgi:secondary thiamine-phosphate synthase enzyme